MIPRASRGLFSRASHAFGHRPRPVERMRDGRLDLGPWQTIFYCEFDGRRRKRVVVKAIGE